MKNTFRLDPNHPGIRLGMLISITLGVVIGLTAIPRFVRSLGAPDGAPTLAGVVGAILLAAGLAWLAERTLRALWPSGRSIEIHPDRMEMHEKKGDTTTIRWDGGVAVQAWCFVINTRRAWVPKGWYCVALRLSQGDETIIPYAFGKPSAVQELPGWSSYKVLIPRKQAEEVGSDVFASQAQLRAAEEERWWAGGEMQWEDFVALAREVNARLPGWPGASA